MNVIQACIVHDIGDAIALSTIHVCVVKKGNLSIAHLHREGYVFCKQWQCVCVPDRKSIDAKTSFPLGFPHPLILFKKCLHLPLAHRAACNMDGEIKYKTSSLYIIIIAPQPHIWIAYFFLFPLWPHKMAGIIKISQTFEAFHLPPPHSVGESIGKF